MKVRSLARRLTLATIVAVAGLPAWMSAATAATLVVVCEPTDNHFMPETFRIDMDARTVNHRSPVMPDQVFFTVGARISEDGIQWSWKDNQWILDRNSGRLVRVVQYQGTSSETNWQCRTMAPNKRAIE